MTQPLVVFFDEAECWEHLHSQSFGRIALSTDGRIVVTPIRYIILGGKFYFQMVSREKLTSIVISRIATLEIDGADGDGALKAVTARGTAHWHTHELKIAELDAVRFGSVPDDMNWVEFVPESVSGYLLVPQATGEEQR